MDKPLGVVEPIDEEHRKSRSKVLGIPITFTPFAVLAYPLHTAIATPYAWLKGQLSDDPQDRTWAEVAVAAQRYGMMAMVTNYLHSLGHILSGKAVDAPMDELIVTATRQITRYEGDQSGHPTSTHIARAAGGPAINALVAVAGLVAFVATGKKRQGLADFALFNAISAALALLPVESVDGGSILKKLGAKDMVIGS